MWKIWKIDYIYVEALYGFSSWTIFFPAAAITGIYIFWHCLICIHNELSDRNVRLGTTLRAILQATLPAIVSYKLQSGDCFWVKWVLKLELFQVYIPIISDRYITLPCRWASISMLLQCTGTIESCGESKMNYEKKVRKPSFIHTIIDKMERACLRLILKIRLKMGSLY